MTTLAAASCREGDDDFRGPAIQRADRAGAARSFHLGLGVIPAAQSQEAYIVAFATAAQYADVALIQRPPPWADFLPGARVSHETEDATRLETSLAKQYGVDLFYAIDPTDGTVERSRLANLPPQIDPAVGFNDTRLRSAFISYAAYVAKNYRPAYLAIGVEINMLAERRPDQFEAFVSLYREAFDVARAASPKTRIFPTFQLEDLEGNFGNAHPPNWSVIDRFRGRMDALAISTYPFLAGIPSANDLRPDYYVQLKQHYDGEILIAESGYASAPVGGRVTVGTEEDQRAFLARLLGDVERLGFTLAVWTAPLDPPVFPGGAGTNFRDIGLRKIDGANKLAWAVWEEWSRRPLEPRHD